MIARDSKSYPYLAIAQFWNIPYHVVLAESDKYDKFNLKPPYTEWRLEVWLLEQGKRKL